MKRLLCLLMALLLLAPAALADVPMVGSVNAGPTQTGYVSFVYKNLVLREKEVTYYPDVWAENHGDWGFTHFDGSVPAEYFVRDATGHLAVAPAVMDVVDAMRLALYQADIGEEALLFGQYTEIRKSKDGRLGYSGIHEGIDFVSAPGTQLHAILDGEVLKAGGDKDGTIAVYNQKLDATVLYLHCRNVFVKRGDKVVAGQPLAEEGDKGSGAPYAHVELRLGKHFSPNPYRNATLQSDLPYAFFADALGVDFDTTRAAVTYEEAQMERQRQLEAEAALAQQQREAQAEADRLAAEEEAAALEEQRRQQEEAAQAAQELEERRAAQNTAEPAPQDATDKDS